LLPLVLPAPDWLRADVDDLPDVLPDLVLPDGRPRVPVVPLLEEVDFAEPVVEPDEVDALMPDLPDSFPEVFLLSVGILLKLFKFGSIGKQGNRAFVCDCGKIASSSKKRLKTGQKIHTFHTLDFQRLFIKKHKPPQ
jgi:hypothetical protein